MAYSRPPLTLGADSETTGNKAEAILGWFCTRLNFRVLVAPVLVPFPSVLCHVTQIATQNACKTAKILIFPEQREGGAKEVQERGLPAIP